MYCTYCGKKIPFTIEGTHFCSSDCSASWNEEYAKIVKAQVDFEEGDWLKNNTNGVELRVDMIMGTSCVVTWKGGCSTIFSIKTIQKNFHKIKEGMVEV